MSDYKLWAGASLALAVTTGLVYFTIHQKYTHTEYRKQDEGGSVKVTVERLPHLWQRVCHRFCALCAPLAVITAVIAASAAFLLLEEARRSHVALSLNPSEPQTVLAGRTMEIVPTMRTCRMDIHWDIEGLSAAKAEGKLGEVTQTGTYSAPRRIDEELDLFVVATPLERLGERRKLKIQLRFHPAYSTPHETSAEDPNGKTAEVVIEVLEKGYSWRIGTNVIERPDGTAVDGEAFARKMARTVFLPSSETSSASVPLLVNLRGERRGASKKQSNVNERAVAHSC